MMAQFEPTTRILFESSKTNLNVQIAREINRIDSLASDIRKAETGDVREDLKGEIAGLKRKISQATVMSIAALNEEIDGYRSKWTKDRDANPDRELAQLRRSESEVNGMSDTEVRKIGESFTQGATDMSTPELNAVRARLRSIDTDLLGIVNETARTLHTDSPWLQSPESANAYHYKTELEQLKPGQVAIGTSDNSGSMSLDVETLIDYDGELSRPSESVFTAR